MAFAKFQENRLRIDGAIAENHAILVNLMASIYHYMRILQLNHSLIIIILKLFTSIITPQTLISRQHIDNFGPHTGTAIMF